MIIFTKKAGLVFIYVVCVFLFRLWLDADRDKLAQSKGRYAEYLCKILEVYFAYHHDAYSMKGKYFRK